jgi:hypothetical protein
MFNSEYRAVRFVLTMHVTICRLARRQPKTKEPFMKMHLVMTAVFAGLCSHAAFAASEAGDTWSAVQERAVAGSIKSPMVAKSLSSSSLKGAFPITASEGGDTWSAVQALAYAGSTQSPIAAITTSSISPKRGFPTATSEGGDTWSAVQALAHVRSTQSLTTAQ